MKYDALADIRCVRGFQLQAELAASVNTPNSSCARLWVTCRPSAVPHWSQVGGSKQRVFEKTASVLLQRTEPCRPVLCNTAQIQESGLQEIKMWPPACVRVLTQWSHLTGLPGCCCVWWGGPAASHFHLLLNSDTQSQTCIKISTAFDTVSVQ